MRPRRASGLRVALSMLAACWLMLSVSMGGRAAQAAGRTTTVPAIRFDTVSVASGAARFRARVEIPTLIWPSHVRVADRVNAALQAWALGRVRSFARKAGIANHGARRLPKGRAENHLSVVARTALRTSRVVSFTFEIEPYFRGEASPAQIPAGLTFSLITGRPIRLVGLVHGPGGEARLARLATAGLRAFRPAGAHCYVGGMGTHPALGAWWLSPAGLVLAFPAGQYTAAYCGPATVTVTSAELPGGLGLDLASGS